MINSLEEYKKWIALAYTLEQSHNIEDSILAYQKAISINPNLDYIYKKLADIFYFEKNDAQMAAYYCKKLIELNQNDKDAKGCLGLSDLKMKNYKDGWKNFEYRPHKQKSIDSRRNIIAQKSLWQGQDISDKTIYVYQEAGFGDTIMFSRFLLKLKKVCKKVLFEPEVACIELYKDSGLGIEILDSRNVETYPNFDVHTPVMSLPYLLGLTKEEDIIVDNYLKPNLKKVEDYKDKYFKNSALKVGIKWRGKEEVETNRKINLKEFYKLFDIKGVKFYSVQKGDGIEQLEEAREFNIIDLGSTFENFSDTAAAIANFDLVICNDTSVAHLAGAMGKACWILLPFRQDWRWSEDLSYCPWYKSVKLFKQSNLDNWAEVFERVYIELEHFRLV